MRHAPARSTREVFRDHLRNRRAGALEEDLARNYADDIVLLTGDGIFRGKDGVRRCARLLHERLPCVRYRYRTTLVKGEAAFLEWSALCPTAEVADGADSFLIRGGRIVVQTIHYTPRPRRRGKPQAGRVSRRASPSSSRPASAGTA
jgi:hypothetical protein